MLASKTAGTTPAGTGGRTARRLSILAGCALGAILAPALVEPAPSQARAPSYDGTAPTCYLTGGGGLEVCRDGSEAEGVLIAPAPCAFVRGVQILRLARSEPPGPLQMVFQGQSPLASRRRDDPCPARRASDPRDGGSLRTGRSPEQLATTLPPSADRFWVDLPEVRRNRGGRDPELEQVGAEGIGPRDPVAVAGRDWAGEEYTYVFLLGQEAAGGGAAAGNAREENDRRERRGRRRRAADEAAEDAAAQVARRRVQIEARTLDFERFEIRTRTGDGYGLTWTPFEPADGKRRDAGPNPAAVLDEAGKPVASACTAPPFETHGLSGSISVVERTYHYFYTDVLPEDCGLPPEKRRTALYLRTSKDLSAQKVWSSPRKLLEPLPPGSLVRVARAKGMQRWAVSYTCQRPANAPGGPVADICLQYTADLGLDTLAKLKLYADPVEAGRSTAYLGLRSGGDGSGRYDRSAHFWMTDAYGNLDVPGVYAGKGGLLTWLDRLAPAAIGRDASSLYGRPVYWATWTVRPVGAQ